MGIPIFHGNNEIEQIGLISDVLGTPSPENWPSITSTPDYGKILFKEKPKKNLKDVIPHAHPSEIEFLGLCLKYDCRLSAKDVTLF